MASGDSSRASDSSNLGSSVGSFFCGGIGSLAASEVSEKASALSATVGGAIAVTAK
jgi:hypothetical protein